MAYVEILKTGFDQDEVVARVVLGDNNTVNVAGPEHLRALILRPIVVGERTFTPADGITFLEMLKYEFSGSRVRATEVKY